MQNKPSRYINSSSAIFCWVEEYAVALALSSSPFGETKINGCRSIRIISLVIQSYLLASTRSALLTNKIIISGWSFVIGIIGSIASVLASVLFLSEATVFDRKLRQLKESQTRFDLQGETKA